MRDIRVSVDVFARIWALRRVGEVTEDDVLRRLLGVNQGSPVPTNSEPVALSTGFFDQRHSLEFAAGFEIFRNYKGRSYTAKASSGTWVLQTGERFNSLNELSRFVVSGSENAWLNWSYRDANGQSKRISELRDEGKLSRRKANEGFRETTEDEMISQATWREDVVSALIALGGQGSLDKIYREVEQIRQSRGTSLPPSTDAIIRRELENNSSDSASYLGRNDLFYSVRGLGEGFWGLRSTKKS